jgi:integrase
MDERTALTVRPVEVEVLTEEEWRAETGLDACLRRNDGGRDELLALLAQAVVGQQAPKLSEQDRARVWPVAFDEWLAENPRTGAPRPGNTREAYAAAWEDFRQFCPKVGWKVEGIDVKEWVEDLRRRVVAPHVAKGLVANGRRTDGQVGLSDSTINQYLAAISAFFSFAEQYEVRTLDGRVAALFEGVNPAKSRMVKRPKAQPFGKSMYLDIEQLRALLQAIRSYREVNPAKALRDYALFLCYVSTGARNSEVREWRWGDLERRGAVTFYRWSNKGKTGIDELPADAWGAVEEFLKATGRAAGIQDDDFIFQPLSDAITRLKRLDGSAVVDAETWDRNRALSAAEVNRSLRMYAKRAGLETKGVHVHVLRHSAYMLYREAGLSLEERSRLLHHSSLAITSIYDHAVAGQRNVGWTKAATLLGL